MIEFVVASHNPKILKENIVKSDIYSKAIFHVMQGYNNIPAAYNDARPRSGNIVVYVHHDVWFPDTFQADLVKSLKTVPDDWGVLGVAGVRLRKGKEIHGYILDRGNVWGRPLETPIEVDTLDELLLITRGDMIFDEQFPFDFYGGDICMQGRERGLKCYAINAFCHHNSTRPFGGRTPSFYESEAKLKTKWSHRLPIVTTCSLIS